MSETLDRLEEARAAMRDMADGLGVPLRLAAGKRSSLLAEALAEAEATALDAAAEEGLSVYHETFAVPT